MPSEIKGGTLFPKNWSGPNVCPRTGPKTNFFNTKSVLQLHLHVKIFKIQIGFSIFSYGQEREEHNNIKAKTYNFEPITNVFFCLGEAKNAEDTIHENRGNYKL